MPKKVAESLPDEIRCRRTDGRKWRCTRRVVEGKKLCDIHYDQGRRRQLKQPVPDHLKLERQSKKISKDGKKSKKKGSSKIAKRKVSLSETVEKAVRLVRLKRGDIRLELTREYLKMLVENKKKKKKEEEERKEKCNEDDDDELESTLVLPFGVMAISKRNSDNAGSSVGVDVKIEGASSSNSPDSMRTFRSKTIEPLPIGTLQVMPSVALMRKAKKCHWCRKNVSRNMIKCLKCRKLFFCWECIRQRQLERKEVKEECPVCLGICSCKICGKQKSEEMDPKEFKRDKSNVGNVDLLNYCIYMLFPVLKKINRDQRMELEKEATLTGKLPSRVDVQQLGLDDKHSCHCNNCKISILDYHRSCAKCSYNLCLNCCWELSRHNSKQKGSKSLKRDDEIPIKSATKMQNWGACSDGSLVCPPVKLGGCGEGNLDLRCIFPLSWMKELEAGAAGLVQNYDFLDTRNFVCDCQSVRRRTDDKDGEVRQKHKVAKRVESSENIIYCVPLKPNKEELEHFQQHWAKGQPVIARNVIQGESFLKWDPIQMFITHLEEKASKSQNKNAAKKENPDLDWYEVGFSSKQYYFSRDGADIDMAEQTVKIKSWLSPCLFEEQFPALHAELMQSLPLQDYVNPISGFLNLALKLPAEEPTGPYIHIFSGVSEDFSRDEFLTKLCYDSNDAVNILAFATDEPMTTEQKKKIKTLVGLLKSKAHLQDTMGKGKASLGALARVPYITGNSVDEYIASAQKGCTVIDPEKTDSDSGYDSDMTMHITYTNIEPGSDDEHMLTELARSFPSLETDVTKLCGAHWDIFRRQDAPKIMEYLRRHSHELWDEFGYSIHEVHPILDQTYYLDGFHKMRLKEEFGVQVWTFHQYPGEAIMIPAGCPYQMRRPRSCDSCLSVKIEFVSPESLAECIRLTDEIRHLPMDHKVRAKLSEVRKMAIHGTNSAIQELQDLMCKETDGMQGD